MQKFTLLLKNTKLRTYSTISWLIIALNIPAFVYVAVTGAAGLKDLPYYASALLVFIAIFRVTTKNESFQNDSLNLAFCIAIIAWLVIQFYWVAVAIFVLFLFADISRRKLILLVFDDRIVYPSFPKRTIEWKELNNVIIKDGLLTIDFKTNKILQDEIISPASEIDFNEFCETRLNALKN